MYIKGCFNYRSILGKLTFKKLTVLFKPRNFYLNLNRGEINLYQKTKENFNKFFFREMRRFEIVWRG